MQDQVDSDKYADLAEPDSGHVMMLGGDIADEMRKLFGHSVVTRAMGMRFAGSFMDAILSREYYDAFTSGADEVEAYHTHTTETLVDIFRIILGPVRVQRTRQETLAEMDRIIRETVTRRTELLRAQPSGMSDFEKIIRDLPDSDEV